MKRTLLANVLFLCLSSPFELRWKMSYAVLRPANTIVANTVPHANHSQFFKSEKFFAPTMLRRYHIHTFYVETPHARSLHEQ
jgi:hypothetical protein